MYDNQITKIENLEGLVNLSMLDISHNRLRSEEFYSQWRLFRVFNSVLDIKIRNFWIVINRTRARAM